MQYGRQLQTTIAGIYNQGIEDRGATFETDSVPGWAGLSSYRPSFPLKTASRALCRACGFREVGVYEKHGCLDGQWTDVVIVERLIPENLTPPRLGAAADRNVGEK